MVPCAPCAPCALCAPDMDAVSCCDSLIGGRGRCIDLVHNFIIMVERVLNGLFFIRGVGLLVRGDALWLRRVCLTYVLMRVFFTLFCAPLSHWCTVGDRTKPFTTAKRIPL